MRVACQTIPWKARPKDVGGMFRDIGRAGYEGVEIAQHPRVFRSADKLLEHLIDFDLELVGLAGGTLHERVQFLDEFIALREELIGADDSSSTGGANARSEVRPYIYVDNWEGSRSQAVLDKGHPLALHPHMFQSVQTAGEAEGLLRRHPKLRFLPDSAHLTVAGNDVLKVIERNFDRLEAVHLKDWRAEFGRAYPFYSRGFAELGTGDVCLREIIGLLKDRGYEGWLVVEQDVAVDPYESVRISREWLKQECGI